MGTSERRQQILRTLCKRRHETIENLAREFGVSKRTIQRDIEVLSVDEPLYTTQGRFGGVFVVDGYHMDKKYFTGTQKDVLCKIIAFAQEQTICALTEKEIEILNQMLVIYSKPCVNQ